MSFTGVSCGRMSWGCQVANMNARGCGRCMWQMSCDRCPGRRYLQVSHLAGGMADVTWQMPCDRCAMQKVMAGTLSQMQCGRSCVADTRCQVSWQMSHGNCRMWLAEAMWQTPCGRRPCGSYAQMSISCICLVLHCFLAGNSCIFRTTYLHADLY